MSLENAAYLAIVIASGVFVLDRLYIFACAIKYDRDMKKGVDRED